MEVQFDPSAIRGLIEESRQIPKLLKKSQDQRDNALSQCKTKFNRLQSVAQEQYRQAKAAYNDAQSRLNAAQADYAVASRRISYQDSEGNTHYRYADPAGMQAAQAKMAQARQDMAVAQEKIAKAQANLNALAQAWQNYGQPAQSVLMRAGDRHAALAALSNNSVRDLNDFSTRMRNAEKALYGEITSGPRSIPSHRNGGGGAAPGWCQNTGMTSVHLGANGQKQFTVTIGGSTQTYPLTKSGTAKAYRAAVKSGDQDMIARTAAMFEVETIREQLELTAGAPDVPQLGGYYGRVKVEDPARFEANHIPSKATMDEDIDFLPALTMSRYDHTDTPSHSGKQNTKLSSYAGNVTYKQAITQQIGQGGSGYIEAMRDELLDLRKSTGNRYDGGVSGFLDAVIDMFATRGIPKAKH